MLINVDNFMAQCNQRNFFDFYINLLCPVSSTCRPPGHIASGLEELLIDERSVISSYQRNDGSAPMVVCSPFTTFIFCWCAAPVLLSLMVPPLISLLSLQAWLPATRVDCTSVRRKVMYQQWTGLVSIFFPASSVQMKFKALWFADSANRDVEYGPIKHRRLSCQFGLLLLRHASNQRRIGSF